MIINGTFNINLFLYCSSDVYCTDHTVKGVPAHVVLPGSLSSIVRLLKTIPLDTT